MSTITSEEKFDFMLRGVSRRVVNSVEIIEEWKRTLDESPTYALEWSEKLYSASAQWHAYQYLKVVLETVEDKNTDERQIALNKFRSVLQRDVIRGARNPGRSTSRTSNLMAEYILEEKAKMLEDFDFSL